MEYSPIDIIFEFSQDLNNHQKAKQSQNNNTSNLLFSYTLL